eukprot:m.156582 g.156582  ORF g.156582 m.156582 type:complete len:367 (-) comp31006_c0_seq1:96-1196(-)
MYESSRLPGCISNRTQSLCSCTSSSQAEFGVSTFGATQLDFLVPEYLVSNVMQLSTSIYANQVAYRLVSTCLVGGATLLTILTLWNLKSVSVAIHNSNPQNIERRRTGLPLSDKQPRIAFVGDSITYGDGSLSLYSDRKPKGRGSYPAATKRAMNVYGAVTKVKMFALGGTTALKGGHLHAKHHSCTKETNSTALTCSFWDTVAFKNLIEFAPDIIVIMFGTNDSKEDDAEALQHNYLADLIELIEATASMQVFVMIPTRVIKDSFSINEHRLQTVIRAELQQLPHRLPHHNVNLIDLTKAVSPNALNVDGVHPTRVGSLQIAQCVFSTLIVSGVIVDTHRSMPFVTPCCDFNSACPSWDTLVEVV